VSPLSVNPFFIAECFGKKYTVVATFDLSLVCIFTKYLKNKNMHPYLKTLILLMALGVLIFLPASALYLRISST